MAGWWHAMPPKKRACLDAVKCPLPFRQQMLVAKQFDRRLALSDQPDLVACLGQHATEGTAQSASAQNANLQSCLLNWLL